MHARRIQSVAYHETARVSRVVLAFAGQFWTRFGVARQPFTAALIATAVLLVPNAAQAGLIVSWKSVQSGSFEPEQLSLETELNCGSRCGELDRARQERIPINARPRRAQDGNLWAALDSTGGTTNVPPQGGTGSGSIGLLVNGTGLASSRVVGRVSMDQILVPLSPLPDGLMDPPKVSS